MLKKVICYSFLWIMIICVSSGCSRIGAVRRTPIPIENCTRTNIVEQYLCNENIDQIEGIWEMSFGNIIFELAIIENNFSTIPSADYTALILDTNRGGWMRGETKMLLRKTAENGLFIATYFLDKSSKDEYRTKLKQTGENSATLTFHSGTRASLLRLYPEYSEKEHGHIENEDLDLKKQYFSKYDGFLDCVVVVRASDGIGSGFFVSQDGYLITNHHVVENEELVSIQRRSGETSLAKVIKSDKKRDLALLKADGGDFPWLKMGIVGDAKVGADVLAIGAPESFEWTVTKGIVSAIREDFDPEYIQTDASINHGNSGGPLISLTNGNVVGVNTWGIKKDIAEGLNFAVSAEEVRMAFPGVFQ